MFLSGDVQLTSFCVAAATFCNPPTKEPIIVISRSINRLYILCHLIRVVDIVDDNIVGLQLLEV